MPASTSCAARPPFLLSSRSSSPLAAHCHGRPRGRRLRQLPIARPLVLDRLQPLLRLVVEPSTDRRRHATAAHGFSGFNSAPPGSGGLNVPAFPYFGYPYLAPWLGRRICTTNAHLLPAHTPLQNPQGIPPHPRRRGMVAPLHPSRRCQCLQFIAHTVRADYHSYRHSICIVLCNMSFVWYVQEVTPGQWPVCPCGHAIFAPIMAFGPYGG